MGANIDSLAGFTKRNRRSCEIFLRKARENFGATVLAKTVAPKLVFDCKTP